MSRNGSGSQRSVRSLKLSPLHIQAGENHPEEWTLVGVHKMEKREPFDCWYSDLQANILNCARKINDSLEKHPHPNANFSYDDINQSRYVIDMETDRVMNDVYRRFAPSTNPAFYKVTPQEEIRLYKGL